MTWATRLVDRPLARLGNALKMTWKFRKTQAQSDKVSCNDYSEIMILVEKLLPFPKHFKNGNSWAFGSRLCRLKMNMNHVLVVFSTTDLCGEKRLVGSIPVRKHRSPSHKVLLGFQGRFT